MPSSIPEDQFQAVEAHATTPHDLLKIAQMTQLHQSQIVKLAKAIPSMIQQAIKKAMQPARDKLRGLCTIVEVLENEVITLRKDVATLTTPPPTSNPTPPEPAAIYHSRPPPPLILTLHEVDPSCKPSGVDTTSYHELLTLPNKWVIRGLGKSLKIPPDPLMSTAAEIDSCHFDVAMYSWGPHPNR
ncbi:hypothetical protein HAX54_037994 [Datura stramonium]|uniref:Uncharacterized protein n=1 Tax=Datura stramonium TaxID=4076 RepID=A0ABS8VKT9_DATST|nr:hypothetical protein [Datura stramonium]